MDTSELLSDRGGSAGVCLYPVGYPCSAYAARVVDVLERTFSTDRSISHEDTKAQSSKDYSSCLRDFVAMPGASTPSFDSASGRRHHEARSAGRRHAWSPVSWHLAHPEG